MGTESYLNDDSMVYNPSTGTYSRAGDIRSGVLTVDAQNNNYVDSLLGADPNAYDSDGAVAPTTDSIGSDRTLTSEELRDIFAANLTASDIYGDPLAGYEGVRDPVTSAVSAAMQNDYLNSILETDSALDTPSTLETLSQAQQDARTEDMLDSILNSQVGADGTGFVNESARIAAEGILRGKIAQAGVIDPDAKEIALNSAMGSLEEGGSGLDAIKAAAAGTQDFVEGLLRTAKDAVDAGYDKLADFLPEGAMPDTVGIDPTTGQTTAVYGKTSGTPVLGGTVGTQGGGTYAGITTTGSAIVDKLIKVIKEGGSASSVISASTGLPGDVVDAAVEAAQTVKEGIEANTLDGNDPSKVVLATTGSEALDPDSKNQVLTVGDDNKEVLGDGVTTTTGDEIIDPNSANQTLTLGDTTKKDDEILGGGKWTNDGAGSLEEVISGRIIGDGFDAGTGPDDKVVVDDKVLDEVISGRIIGDPFTFEPVADEEVPPILDEVPPILDEVPPEQPPEVPEVPEVPEAAQGFGGLRLTPSDVVELENYFDIGGTSIFDRGTKTLEQEDPLAFLYSGYADGGIVQDYDIEELIRFLENQRG
ncbi:hypothetical protein OAU05_00595 [bacterium]|nr:hypothetical protein [bacterium]